MNPQHPRLTTEDALRLLRSGAKGVAEWNEWMAAIPTKGKGSVAISEMLPDLSGVELDDLDLSDLHLHHICFRKAQLRNVKLRGADLRNCCFDGAKLMMLDLSYSRAFGCSFERAELEFVRWFEASLQQTSFNDALMQRCTFVGASVETSRFDGARMRQVAFELSKIHGSTSWQGTQLTPKMLKEMSPLAGLNLTGAVLRDIDLRSLDFRGAKLGNADLSWSDLRGCTVDSKTVLAQASVSGVRIDRYALECLGPDYGGLTKGQRMELEIEDGVATLRNAYSGFLQWIHLTALAVFVLPYVTFLAREWSVAQFKEPSPETLTLGTALVRYIVSGGTSWRSGWSFEWLPITLFAYGFAYNLLRGVLLWKTKQLELAQEARDLPVQFSLASGMWARAMFLGTWGFRVNLVVVAVHAWHFLGQRIPVS